jgi:Domain of unknown function (DUF4405)
MTESPTTEPTVAEPEAPVARPSREAKPAGSRFSKTIVNFWLDSSLLVAFLLLAFTSAVLRFLFPAGPAAADWVLWGADVTAWRNFQFVILCVLALGVLLHLMLHWSWVCGVITTRLLHRKPTKDDGSQTLYGVGTLLVVLHILGIALLVAWASIERVGR